MLFCLPQKRPFINSIVDCVYLHSVSSNKLVQLFYIFTHTQTIFGKCWMNLAEKCFQVPNKGELFFKNKCWTALNLRWLFIRKPFKYLAVIWAKTFTYQHVQIYYWMENLFWNFSFWYLSVLQDICQHIFFSTYVSIIIDTVNE